MSRPIEISQFYGVQVSEYNIQPLRNKNIIEAKSNIYQDNAHIYAFAYQHGNNVPSEARITRTIQKNTLGQEFTVYRLDRMFRNYTKNPYQQIFKKPKKVHHKLRAIPSKTQVKPFQVHSPEQIVLKAARQAYAQSIIKDQGKVVKKQARKPTDHQLSRKRHQMMRRLERTLILKAYKRELFCIFGSLIFMRGWKIGREELKARLQLPAESFGINLMKGILREREAKARLDSQIFMRKRQKYLRQKRQRKKIQRALWAQERRNYVPHSRIEYPHKQQDSYDQKRIHVLKQKACKEEGERIQRMRKRKLIKQNVWYKQANHPSRKQIKRSIDEFTVQYEDIEEEDQEEFEEVDNLAESAEKDSQITKNTE